MAAIPGRFPRVATGILAVLVLGCDARRSTVHGTLTTSSGLPLASARITVRNEASGQSAAGVTDRQGFFQLGTGARDNVVEPGEYLVIITEDRGDPNQPDPPKIADKYARYSTSGLTLSVAPGEKVIFDVVLDPPKK